MKNNAFKKINQTMVSFVINWISVSDTRYCQVINILLFNSKSSVALLLKEMLQLLYYLIWYLITVISTIANIEREPLVEKKKTI